jgi:hypothetical protein
MANAVVRGAAAGAVAAAMPMVVSVTVTVTVTSTRNITHDAYLLTGWYFFP